MEELRRIANIENVCIESREFASAMDKRDPLRDLREQFSYPKKHSLPFFEEKIGTVEGEEAIYLAGNSLGLMPKVVKETIAEVLGHWGEWGVCGHESGPFPWNFYDELLVASMGKVVGGSVDEVAILNQLTVNLHLFMLSFYQPTAMRYKILHEHKLFPSDRYALESQARFHGLDPAEVMLSVDPRPGENNVRKEDVFKVLEEHGGSIALVLMSGVHYYTGQFMDIAAITKEAHNVGAFVGWDLAHAVGNVELDLHEWGVDFAVWCTYKYMNSGAGSAGGAFLHSKHFDNPLPYLTGWWGHEHLTRMEMPEKLSPGFGIRRYRMSNPSALHCASIRASLSIFDSVGMPAIRAKSILLTGYFEHLLNFLKGTEGNGIFEVITPTDPGQRGAQISIRFLDNQLIRVFDSMKKKGLICDDRRPDVLRMAPCPLYNSFLDVFRTFEILRESIHST